MTESGASSSQLVSKFHKRWYHKKCDFSQQGLKKGHTKTVYQKTSWTLNEHRHCVRWLWSEHIFFFEFLYKRRFICGIFIHVYHCVSLMLNPHNLSCLPFSSHWSPSTPWIALLSCLRFHIKKKYVIFVIF